MAYERTTWSAGMPITERRMNNIEEELVRQELKDTSLQSSITNEITDRTAAINDLNNRVTQNTLDINGISAGSTAGTLAWNQIVPLVDYKSDGTVGKPLQNTINGLSATLLNVQTEINSTHRSGVSNDNLSNRFEGLDNDVKQLGTQMSTLSGTVGSIQTTLIEASIGSPYGDANSLRDRLYNDEEVIKRTETALNDAKESSARGDASGAATYTSLDARLEAGEQEVVDARNSSVYGAKASLDARIEAGEAEIQTARSGAADLNTRLNTIEGNLSAVSGTVAQQVVYKSQISDNLTTETKGNVLDASQGKILADRIDAIDNAENGTIHGLDVRLTAAERGLATNTSDLATANGEIDALKTRMNAVDNSENGSIAVLRSSIDEITTNLGDEESGLIAQVGSLEEAVTDKTNGLAATYTLATNAKTQAQANATAISHAASGNDPGGLTERIDALESQPKSATQVISEVTYNENGIPTSIENPSTDVDYLLKKDDKYYYWKYIQTGSDPDTFVWALISGSGSGEGNTSGMDLTAAEYAVIVQNETYAENTDYYVTESDGFVHHYRYITVNNELTEIEIGTIVDTNNIKRYNMEKIYDDNEKKYYLKLYEYDYNVENNIDTDLSDILPWAASTAYAVDDTVIYNDGYAYKCTTANSDTSWDSTKWTKISNIRTLQIIELPEGGGSGATTGTVKRLTRIGDQSVETITGTKIYLQAFYSYWTTTLNEENQVVADESSACDYVLKSGNKVLYSGNSFASGAYKATVTTYQEGVAGYMQFDVTDYCKTGNTTFDLIVTANGEQLIKSWSITVIDLSLDSSAPEVLLVPISESYEFPYVATGTIEKTLHVVLDNDTEHEITTTLSALTSARDASIQIPPANYYKAFEHGAHKIQMYLTAMVGGVQRSTVDQSIIREYIWYDADNNETVLASPKDGLSIDLQQYSTIDIPYQVYKKDATSITLEYYLDSQVAPFDTVTLEDTNTGKLSYLAAELGAHTLTIKVAEENVSIAVNLTVSKIEGVEISPVKGYIIDFDPTMLSNSSSNRLPTWTVGNKTYSLTASDNFNWSDDANGGGYKTDKDGKCLIIKAGTYIDLDYPLFSKTDANKVPMSNGTKTVLDNGAELKVIFKTNAVRSADAVWFQNVGSLYEKDVGIQLGAHSGWLKTTKAVNDKIVITPDANGIITINGMSYATWQPNTAYGVDDIVVIWDESDDENHEVIYKCLQAWDDTHATFLNNKGKVQTDYWLKIGKINTEISSTDSYLYLPYSEQDKIELDININQYDAEASTNFIMSYEDGVPSKVYAYSYGAGGDGIYHSNTIRIGSPDCDVYIYHLRIYNKSLGTSDILQNFIADGKDIKEKTDRYNRNCIYWDPTQNDGKGQYFISPSKNATLDPVKLAEVLPNVKILMLDTPVFTTGKKDFIQNSTLRCIHAEGGNVYTSRGDADNWFFINGFHAGQGTTSDNYGQSARNIDFLFEVDGVNYPTKSKNMGDYKPSDYPNYKSTVYIGKDASTWDGTVWTPAREAEAIEVCENWKGDNCKVALTESSVPNNYFNLKVNVASSENVNNALFQKRYDNFLAYSSPAQAAQIAKHRNAYAALDMDNEKIKVKNDMEFVPAILFVRENDPTYIETVEDGKTIRTYTKHVEFNDTNWHFYALGNMGDSKKTDYTRAYDPDDINEFTCENSDNNTNNGQFQSGVFMYEDTTRAVETDFALWSETNAYNTNDIVLKEGRIYQRTGAAQAALGENETYNWVAADWTDVTPSTTNTIYYAPRTNPNPMDYIYPISSEEWNVQLNNEYLNRKHATLVNEAFDGDHSFEFRYACKGDYRDGDLINVSEGQDDDAQFNINHDVMLAFYEWVITATKEQYLEEAPQWFVKPAMEFFYAFTHYYTMMDNRAKNTFWHFAKTGTYINVSRPVKELLHVYEESTDNGVTWSAATGTIIDPNKKYRTQYAFDLWAYDMDTAAGIDNNGELAFPYGKEDDDYRIENVPTSGYAFNGAGSIFWRRLKASTEDGGFADEIADIMNRTDVNCFNSEDLINEFDQFQNCFPEEIWRLDIERKYIRTFTGESIDNSIVTGKQNPRFLTSMMQGRKKYQRRQWIRNQGLYFNSKYRLKDVTVASNTVEFNIITPANSSNLAVQPNYDLKLTPYQDMYLNVTIGNGGPTPSIRAKAGKEYTIPMADYSSGTFGETRIYIYGFSGISGIGNLAPMYPYKFTLNALDRLKELDIGTDNSGYVNANLTALPFTANSSLPLLETLNVKNCHSLAGSLALNKANNLRTVKAQGTSITGINLPQYTNIETLYLPSSVTDLVLSNARKLVDFKMYDNNGNIDYSGLYTLYVYDSDYSAEWQANKEYTVGDTVMFNGDFYNCIADHTSVSAATKNNSEAWNAYLTANWEVSNGTINLPVDWMSIAAAMIEKESQQTEIALLKLTNAAIDDIQEMESFKNFKAILAGTGNTIDFSGTLRVMGDYSDIEKETYEDEWSELTLDVSQAHYTPKHKVTYNYYEGDEAKSYSMYVETGHNIIDIYEYIDENTQEVIHTLSAMPYRNPTISTVYQFGLRESGVYIPFSGWKLRGSSTPISSLDNIPIVGNSDIIIDAYFKETDRTYPIKWYLEKNTNGTPKESTLIKTSGNPVPYGGGYDEEAPTVKQIHDAGFSTASMSISGGIATYSIFNGWEKLPTNINPSATDNTFVIYANWDSGSIDLQELFADTTTFSPVQLLALSMMSTSERTYAGVESKVAPSKQFSYTMGYDSIKEGTELVGPNATRKILRLGLATSTPYVTNIQPMAETNGFTLAIDYCFTEDATYAENYTDATLASCYYTSSSGDVINGFALYDHLGPSSDTLGPKVGFGDMFSRTDKSVAVGSSQTKGQRNIVVLRHPAGSDKLYVYSGMNSNLSLADNVVVQNITWNNSTSNAQLVLGRITNSTDNQYSTIKSIVANGKGTIYWAKYWPEDLGAGECKRIASWPHEEITYAFATYEDRITGNNRTGINPPNPALELVTFTTSSHGKIVQTQAATSDGAITGWGTSVARTVYNNRVFAGLPTELQAIICKPEKQYKNFKVVYGSQGDNEYALESIPSSTRDYIYAPSANNLAANTSAYTAEELNSNLKPYMWLNDDTRVTVYNYDPNDTEHNYWPSENVSDRAHYLNLRFNNKPITGTSANPLRIFRETTISIASSTNIYTVVNNIPGGIKSGDIFIKSNGTAYLYVTNDDINNKGIQIVERTGLFATNDNGGWLPASEYWTRSMGYGTMKVKFVYVDKTGHVELNDTNSASASGLNINYALSI